jgi:C4-type Zn-finger protein
MSEADQNLRYVFITRPRCPVCGATDLKTLRSQTDVDGSTCRRTECKTCGWKFFIVVEDDCHFLASGD